MTADHMNSPNNRVKLLQQLQTPLSPKPKIFSQFFLHSQNLHKILHLFKAKKSFIAQIFWKLLFPKNMVTWMPESFRFVTPLRNQRVHGSQTMTNSPWPHFYPHIPPIQDKSELEDIFPSQIWELRIVW